LKRIKVSDATLQDKIDRLYAMGQGHIFRYWDELSVEKREYFLLQIERLDLTVLSRLIELGTGKAQSIVESYHLEPAKVITLKMRRNRDAAVIPLGEKALQEGKVAAFLVAGGQGTRLGFAGPKGAFLITPVKQKSIFQLHAEKILAVQHKYHCIIPWYIMTSQTNHIQTVNFFKDHNYFGLKRENIYFFRQEMLPAIDFEGKLILAEKHSLFLSPNGHGGSVKALWDSGAVKDMQQRGIEYIFYFQVDNVLANICDPAFIGYHIAGRGEMSNKVVRKRHAEERMGVICLINGQEGVVEYSDLSKEDMYATTADGQLKYWAGSIAIHMMNVEFIEQANINGFILPFHKALKKVPYLDAHGNKIQPQQPNGIKFETFVFDLLFQAGKTLTLEVDRRFEFSPVKNNSGEDSPQTARRHLLWNYARMLLDAGINLPVDDEGVPRFPIEISPLFALNADDIRKKKERIGVINKNTYLE